MHKIEKEHITKLLLDLVSIKSPYFEEDEIVDYVYSWFKLNNIEAFVHEYHESKVTGFKGKNVIVDIKGSNEGPVICLNGHLDTVRLCSGWTVNPSGVIIVDKLYGVGALDMKSGVAGNNDSHKNFCKNHRKFNGRILSTYVSAEEGPYGMGTNALIEEGFIDDIDISIITEPSPGFPRGMNFLISV